MGGIFDQLHDQIGGDDEDVGLTPLDLRDLPGPMRKLMRLMLREVEMTAEELRAAVDQMPEEDYLDDQALDETLKELVRQQWLIQYGETKVRYEANLKRKAGSTVAKSIWASLDSKISQQRQIRESDANKSPD